MFRPTRYGDGDATAAAMRVKASASLDDSFAIINRKLSDGRPYVHGDQYTVSDPYLLVFSRWLDRAELGPVDKFPLVAAHRRRLEARAAVQKVLATEAQA